MINPFADISEVVIDYVRRTFAAANDKVTRTMSVLRRCTKSRWITS